MPKCDSACPGGTLTFVVFGTICPWNVVYGWVLYPPTQEYTK